MQVQQNHLQTIIKVKAVRYQRTIIIEQIIARDQILAIVNVHRIVKIKMPVLTVQEDKV